MMQPCTNLRHDSLFAKMNKDIKRPAGSWQLDKLNSLNRHDSHDGDASRRRSDKCCRTTLIYLLIGHTF